MLLLFDVSGMARNQMPLLQKQAEDKIKAQRSMTAFACRVFLLIKCKTDEYVTEGEKMQKQIQQKAAPWVLYTVLGLAGFSVLALTTIVPIAHWVPVSITESATVVAVTEQGCVVEGSYGYPVVVSNCSAQPGETIQVSYNMPAIVQSEYIKRVQQKASFVQP